MPVQEKKKHRYAVVEETWRVVVHDFFDDEENSQFYWEENHCSGNEAAKVGRRADWESNRSTCSLCYAGKVKLLGVYDTLEAAAKAHRCVPVEPIDYLEKEELEAYYREEA